ncbi:MAG: hypothetical protein JWM99_4605 [Verrucomicrobiales bacterium]|nr:hypothetical protein [Verrucomicrobiales bacterium]
MKPKKSSPKPKAASAEKAEKAPIPTAKKSSAPPVANPIPPAESSVTKPRRAAPKIPAALLEGDKSTAPASSGPGSRYALGPKSTNAAISEPIDLGELPESYGTQRVLAAARDPHWLYVSWDLSKDQLRKYNGQSIHGHLVVRVHIHNTKEKPHAEVHVHPESRNWFVYVGLAATRFVAELGFYRAQDEWQSIGISRSTFTPPDNLSEDTSVEFATLPGGVSFQELIGMVKEVLSENVSLVDALREQSREGGRFSVPKSSGGRWTADQAAALEKLVSMDSMRRVWIGSLEITELIRRKMFEETSSIAAADLARRGLAVSSGVSSLSSPFGGAGAEKSKGFWFNVNAELIVYGSTEPDAKVTVGGRAIKLRADGSFSYRFSLPDGNYELPAIAKSALEDDERHAHLKFSRHTDYHGNVGKHPQDKNLKPPHPDNLG